MIVFVLALGITVVTGHQANAGSWCFIQTDSFGSRDCGYYTLQQCLASRAGGSSHCSPNPAFVAPPSFQRTRPTRRR
jgi:hypothetical protein